VVPTKDLRVKYVPIGDVRPYEDNPRRNDGAVRAVVNSLREFGWKQPVVVDADGTIIAGHTRYKAALALEMTHVPVVVASDLTPEQCAAYRLADNRTAELAEWDAELLAQELDGLADLDMSQFGFDSGETLTGADIDALFDDGGGDRVDVPDISMDGIDLGDVLDGVTHVYWSFSGGRDSTLALVSTYKTFRDMGKACQVLFVSSGCEFPDLEVHVRRVCKSLDADLVVLRPDYNFLTEYADKGRFPNPVYMDCVERLINRPIDTYVKSQIGDEPYILVRGGKASQKTSRSKTARLQRVKGKPSQTIYNPAYDYTEEQLSTDIPIWRGYEEGFDRTACWCCPFQKKNQWDALRKCYPLLWDEMRRMFETMGYPRINGDGHPKYVEDYWCKEYGVGVRWC
jgi:3'-phosphoadenosine 5'-phosphosulfate sulfotransferase (PAPS reductase)/FAD synthetase